MLTAISAFVVLVAGGLALHHRARPTAAGAIVLGGLAALALLPLVAEPAGRPAFEEALPAIVVVACLTFVSLLASRSVFPRLPGRVPVVAMAAILALAQAGAAIGLWRAGDRVARLPTVPVARSLPELTALQDGPRAARRDGVLTAARIGPPDAGGNSRPGREIARYACRSSDGDDDVWFPAVLTLTLDDGHAISAHGPRAARHAWNWPESELRLGLCALRVGDPVVVWSRLADAARLDDGSRTIGLVETRLVAFGDPDSVARDYMPAAAAAGRRFAVAGMLAILLSIIPIAGAVRILARRSRGD